jgi:hypothetical protein
MAFETFDVVHDPSDSAVYTWRFALGTDLSMAAAVVDVVDATSTTIDAATDMVLSELEIALFSATTNEWRVSVRVSSATAGRTYYLRCRGRGQRYAHSQQVGLHLPTALRSALAQFATQRTIAPKRSLRSPLRSFERFDATFC